MSRQHRIVAMVAAIAGVASSGSAHAAYAPAELLFTFKGSAILESSGIAQSRRDPSILFTHNDSAGAVADALGRFFAVDAGGFTATEFSVRGGVCADWEDMAPGVASDGTPVLYLADIGDNAEVRTFSQIYEVAEPAIVPGVARADVVVRAVHLLVYEDGPHNAETFFVDPRDNSFIVVTKDTNGRSGVYAADAGPADGSPRILRRIADIRFDQLASVPTSGALLATGGAIAADRSRLVVRTYEEAFEWELGGLHLQDALAEPPLRIALPDTQQGEAITYATDGAALLTSSEGLRGPVHRLRRL